MVSAGHVPTHQAGPLAAVVLLLDGVMGEGGADGGGGALQLWRGGTRGHSHRLLHSKLPTIIFRPYKYQIIATEVMMSL